MFAHFIKDEGKDLLFISHYQTIGCVYLYLFSPDKFSFSWRVKCLPLFSSKRFFKFGLYLYGHFVNTGNEAHALTNV